MTLEVHTSENEIDGIVDTIMSTIKTDLHRSHLDRAQAKKKQSFVRSGNDLELDVTTSKETSYKLPDTLPHLMSSDMHHEMMRQKWESEANELLERGQDEVHYSNVQFDGQLYIV